MKKIILAAVSSTVFCIGNSTSAAATISSPVAGVADHVVSGSAPSPTVTWTDSPSVAGNVGDGAAIGTLRIGLPGSVTDTGMRNLLVASECGIAGRRVLEFVNNTDMSTQAEGRPEEGTLRGRLTKPDGWGEAVDSSDGAVVWGGVVWAKEGASNAETAVVNVVADGLQSSFPGVYKATFCVQQLIG